MQTNNQTRDTKITDGLQIEPEKKRVYVFYQAVPEEQLLQELTENDTHEQSEQDGSTIGEDHHPLTPTVAATRKTSLPPISVSLILLCIIATAIGYTAYLLILPPSVTITIIPKSVQLETTGSVAIATGNTAANGEILGRLLPEVTMSQSQTAATTGTTFQAAQPGRGTITFYNASLYPQTIVAGTLLTGADGVQVATDHMVTVPAANYPTFGVASIPAHAVQTGAGGNIKAGDIYGPCCLLNVQAANSAFNGGQEAETYQSVSKQDIDQKAASLKTSLTQVATAALQTQVQNNETLVTPLACHQTVTADHQPGEKATHVQVTESLSCTGITYETTSFQQWLTQGQAQAASNEVKEHYYLIGDIRATAIQTTEGQARGTYLLTVRSRGTWVYAFSQKQLKTLTTIVAGKTSKEATQILLHTPGIQQVSIPTNPLPSDPQNIHTLLFIQGDKQTWTISGNDN